MGYKNFRKDAQDEQKFKVFMQERELDTKLISIATGKDIAESEWIEGNHKEFDQRVVTSEDEKYTIEWKMDKRCIDTGNCYIEYWCRGKDSGINATTSDLWAQVVFSNEFRGKLRFGIWKTNDFRKLILEGLKAKTVRDGIGGGDNWNGGSAAVGYLIKEKEIFDSPLCLVDKKMDIRKFLQITGIGR